jgi:hypothetical protein
MPAATRSLLFCLAAAAVLRSPASQAEFRIGSLPPPELSAELSIGGEYDGNVSVEEVDRASESGDYALTLEAGGAIEQRLSERAVVGFNYDYSQSNYRKFSEVDRQTHIVGSDFTWHFPDADAGLSAFYINSRLDGKEFLELWRVSPALSGFVARRWFLRGAYVYQDKTLADRDFRDAITDALEGDVYFFAQGLRRYFNLGYRIKDENARSAPLDYESWAVKLRYIQRLSVFSRLAKLELSWRYEDRDYSSVTPSIGEERSDERHRLGVDLEVPLKQRLFLQLYYQYADYASNLERVDYTQNLGGFRIVYRR